MTSHWPHLAIGSLSQPNQPNYPNLPNQHRQSHSLCFLICSNCCCAVDHLVYLLFWCTIVQWTFVKLYIWSIVLFIKSLTMNTHWDLRFRAQINLDVIQNMAFISLCAPCFFPLFKQHFLSATSVNKVAKVKQLVNMLLGNWLFV